MVLRNGTLIRRIFKKQTSFSQLYIYYTQLLYFFTCIFSRRREESGRGTWLDIARHCHRTAFVFVFSPSRPFLSSRREPGARLRRAITGAETRFSNLSDYNRDSRAVVLCPARSPSNLTLPRPCTPHPRLFITSLRSRRPRTTLRAAIQAGDAWAIPVPPALPPPSTLCSIRVRHCAASRSPDYRDKQPEKPRWMTPRNLRYERVATFPSTLGVWDFRSSRFLSDPRSRRSLLIFFFFARAIVRYFLDRARNLVWRMFYHFWKISEIFATKYFSCNVTSRAQHVLRRF